MKKNMKIVLCCLALVIVLAVFLIFFVNPVPDISLEKVEKIQIWVDGYKAKPYLDASDTETFISLFNQSRYKGKPKGDGITPRYGTCVYFKDGTYISIVESGFLNRNFTVQLYDPDDKVKSEWGYVYNKELERFLKDYVFEKWGLVDQ